jgi:ISXO2-like transposase domain
MQIQSFRGSGEPVWVNALLLKCARLFGTRSAQSIRASATPAASTGRTRDRKRINHEEAYSMDDACTNWVEEFFSRMRSAEIGIHHHIAGAYLLRYAQQRSWRGDNRRLSNGEQVNRLAALSLKRGKSVDFGGYWQRHSKDVHA